MNFSLGRMSTVATSYANYPNYQTNQVKSKPRKVEQVGKSKNAQNDSFGKMLSKESGGKNRR